MQVKTVSPDNEVTRRTSMDIVHSTDIETSPDRLYDAITTQRGLAGWWTPQTRAEPKEGAVNEFSFGELGTITFRVEKLDPPCHVAWSAVQVPPEWKQKTARLYEVTESSRNQSSYPAHPICIRSYL